MSAEVIDPPTEATVVDEVASLRMALDAAAARHERDQERIASLERLIRQERAQYLAEQRRAADAINRLKGKGGPADEATRKALARAKEEIKVLSRYKRQVQRLEGSPLYGPMHRLWRRSRWIRGYDQKTAG